MELFLDRVTFVPQELSNQIILHVCDDVICLKTASLVCKSWLLASRNHLFSTLILNPQKVECLRRLVDNPHPWSWTIMNSVKTLNVCDIPITAGCIVPAFSGTLLNLTLRNIVLPNFNSLADIICALSALQSLALECVQWDGSESRNFESAKCKWLPSQLSRLRLHDSPVSQLLAWIITHPKVPVISDLQLTNVRRYGLPTAAEYFIAAGSNANKLAFSYLDSEDISPHTCPDGCPRLPAFLLKPGVLEGDPVRINQDDRLEDVITLYTTTFGLAICGRMSYFTSLKTLRIDSFLNSSAIYQTNALFWAPKFVASARSFDLSHIIFQLNISRAGDVDAYNVNWDFFDRILMTQLYTNLQVLEFEIVGRARLGGFRSILSLRLPKLASRGILRFSKAN